MKIGRFMGRWVQEDPPWKMVARSLAEWFPALMKEWVMQMGWCRMHGEFWSIGTTGFHADLLSGKVDSPPGLSLIVPGMMMSCAELLPEYARQFGVSPDQVSQAGLTFTIDTVNRRATGRHDCISSPYSLTVRIVDDKGNVYEHTVSDWWYGEKKSVLDAENPG